VHPAIRLVCANPAGKKYQERMQKEFSIKAVSWRGFQDDKSSERIDGINKLLTNIKNSKHYKKPILLFPNIKPKQIAPYFANYNDLLNYSKCWTLYRGLDIRPNGDVVVCADFPDYTLGNINNQSIRQIWQGNKIKLFRASITRNGLLPICNRCCGMFR